jgi:hypothetical protein
MVDDFYVKFTNASRYEDDGNTHVRLAEPRERVQLLLPLLYELMRSDTKPDTIQSCPVCRQVLDLSFARYPRIAKTISIATECKTCNIIVLFESNKIPSWISEYGSLLDKMRGRES